MRIDEPEVSRLSICQRLAVVFKHPYTAVHGALRVLHLTLDRLRAPSVSASSLNLSTGCHRMVPFRKTRQSSYAESKNDAEEDSQKEVCHPLVPADHSLKLHMSLRM
jgi:hypothetical protein